MSKNSFKKYANLPPAPVTVTSFQRCLRDGTKFSSWRLLFSQNRASILEPSKHFWRHRASLVATVSTTVPTSSSVTCKYCRL